MSAACAAEPERLTRGYTVPAGRFGAVTVLPGPRLLSGLERGPSLAEHVGQWGRLPDLSARDLPDLTAAVDLRGRGGAAFPFATKLAVAANSGDWPVVVINAAEGEPASAKDSTLLLASPHLVLDGALLAARALAGGSGRSSVDVHLVVPGDRPAVGRVAAAAIAERGADRRTARRGERIRMTRAWPRFVAGQAQAVLQLLDGHANLPVTAWVPEAVRGLRGRPTLLANAETFAQVAVLARLGDAGYAAVGAPDEPGTTLLTLAGDTTAATVVEVQYGTPVADVLATAGGRIADLLIGGFHGGWLPESFVEGSTVTRAHPERLGASLGAGVLLPLAPGACPVRRTAEIVTYLADQSARRCGPCQDGLPALAGAVDALAVPRLPQRAASAPRRIAALLTAVDGRGACAHPDGTARLVRSMLATFPDEVAAHAAGRCLRAGR